MRLPGIAKALVASNLLLTAQGFLLPFFGQQPRDQISIVEQSPMQAAPGIQLPPTKEPPPEPSGDVILSDVIGNQRGMNIFAGFTRTIDSVYKRLDTSSQNTTVLAPLNSAIQALPRKPWEDPKDYAALGANAYDGKNGEDRAQANLRRFTESHVIPASPWKEGEKVKTLGGNTVWWEQRDGRTFVQPGDVKVDKVVSRVANGQIWSLEGVVNYAA